MLRCLGIDPGAVDQYDRSAWPDLAARIQAVIGTATREEWGARLADRDVCFAPVLTHQEALLHPHLVARRSFLDGDPAQAAPAPRLSRTPLPTPRPAPAPGAHTEDLLDDLGLPGERIQQLIASGAVRQAVRS
jgi:alpha-methylacyl-CoA racemase